MISTNKNVLLCVTGGIAAYKAIDLASKLHDNGYNIKTAMTKHALEFVSKINFSAITNSSTHSDLFIDEKPRPHITLADWADIVVVAPATANMIAKATYGIADDLVSSILLATTKPVLWIPAMNVHMYEHPAVQENLSKLKKRNNFILEPITGKLACGYEGKGKYPPNEEVIYAIRTYLSYKYDLTQKKILITTGATAENIDAMRILTNRSSGKTGLALARAASLRGADVILVHAHIKDPIPHYLSDAIRANTVEEMKTVVDKLYPQMDIIFMVAAVSDFTPTKATAHKIKKGATFQLDLKRTPDILLELGKHKKHQILVGYAAETDDLIQNAILKKQNKNLDVIVANHLQVSGKDETQQIVITSKGQFSITGDKFTAAHQLLDIILQL